MYIYTYTFISISIYMCIYIYIYMAQYKDTTVLTSVQQCLRRRQDPKRIPCSGVALGGVGVYGCPSNKDPIEMCPKLPTGCQRKTSAPTILEPLQSLNSKPYKP